MHCMKMSVYKKTHLKRVRMQRQPCFNGEKNLVSRKQKKKKKILQNISLQRGNLRYNEQKFCKY